MHTADTTLRAQIEDARDLLQQLPSADLGKLMSPVLPAAVDGSLPFWSALLVVLIRDELKRREHHGDT